MCALNENKNTTISTPFFLSPKHGENDHVCKPAVSNNLKDLEIIGGFFFCWDEIMLKLKNSSSKFQDERQMRPSISELSFQKYTVPCVSVKHKCCAIFLFFFCIIY